METFKHARLSTDHIKYMALSAINVAYALYEDDEVEQAAAVLGMCEDCTHTFFANIGVEDLAGDYYFDIDDDNKVFVLPADHNEEDEYEDIFDERFDTLFSA